MSVRFYYLSGSQYAWRVWFALEHKAVPYERVTMSYSDGDFKADSFGLLNPRRKVPVVTDGDLVLYESSAIVEYLEEQYDTGSRLFSADVAARAQQRRMVREVDHYLAVQIEHLVEQVLLTPRKLRSEQEIAVIYGKIHRETSYWNDQIAGKYATGDDISAVDFALYPQLALLDRLMVRQPWSDGRAMFGPRLADWLALIGSLEITKATFPPHWKQ